MERRGGGKESLSWLRRGREFFFFFLVRVGGVNGWFEKRERGGARSEEDGGWRMEEVGRCGRLEGVMGGIDYLLGRGGDRRGGLPFIWIGI